MKIIAVILSAVAIAAPAKHHEHGAHVHGAAALSVAFDGLNGRLELKGAADSFIGFEHAAKSDADKKKLGEALKTFEAKLETRVKLDPILGCRFKKNKLEMESHGAHADFIANFDITCVKSPLGGKIVFDFSDVKGLNDLDITVLAGELQKTAEFKGDPVTVELKP